MPKLSLLSPSSLSEFVTEVGVLRFVEFRSSITVTNDFLTVPHEPAGSSP